MIPGQAYQNGCQNSAGYIASVPSAGKLAAGVPRSGMVRTKSRGFGRLVWMCLVAWLAIPGPLQAEERIRFQAQWFPQAQFAGFMMAQEKGIYAREGLDVELRWSDGRVDPIATVQSGEADFCTAWLAQGIAERSRGTPIVHLGQIIQRSALILVTRRSSGIEHPSHMTGRRVGIWSEPFSIQPRAFFHKFGIEPEVVELNYSIGPFLSGAVDVSSVMYYNEYHKLREAGLKLDELRIFHFHDFGMNFPEDGIYCTEHMRLRRPAVCAAFVRASWEGWDYAFAHEEETVEVVMRYCDRAHLDTNPNHQRWMLRAMAELIRHRVGEDPRHWGTLDAADYETVCQVLLEQGLVRNAPPFGEFHRPIRPISPLSFAPSPSPPWGRVFPWRELAVKANGGAHP